MRTAGDLVEKAASIGLPVSLESLSGFVARLRGLGFLADGVNEPAAAPTTWPQREIWPEEHREQFRSALREARSDLLEEAKRHIDELKLSTFDSIDVKELEAWVDERLEEKEKGKGTEDVDAKKLQKFADLFSSVEQSWFDEGDRESENRDRGVPEATATEPAVTKRGFDPDAINVPAGKPVTLVFTRKTEETCTKSVLLTLDDGKKLERALPLDKPVEIAVTFPKAGKLGYACSMNMAKGVIVVQ